jgi:ActR/RegA family two-component response regulator
MAYTYSAVVVEPGLPGRLWFALLTELSSKAPKARIVAATSYLSAALVRHAEELGLHAVFRKPVDPSQIFSCLENDTSSFALVPTPNTLAEVEWEYINRTIYDCLGNATEAARALGIPRQTLYRKLRKFPPSAHEDPRFGERRRPADTSSH